jgi:hypothetical protein
MCGRPQALKRTAFGPVPVTRQDRPGCGPGEGEARRGAEGGDEPVAERGGGGVASGGGERGAENAAFSSASATGMIVAEPAPCTARAAISAAASGGHAHPAEDTANTARPMASTRRPGQSPSAAAVISGTAKLSV